MINENDREITNEAQDNLFYLLEEIRLHQSETITLLPLGEEGGSIIDILIFSPWFSIYYYPFPHYTIFGEPDFSTDLQK